MSINQQSSSAEQSSICPAPGGAIDQAVAAQEEDEEELSASVDSQLRDAWTAFDRRSSDDERELLESALEHLSEALDAVRALQLDQDGNFRGYHLAELEGAEGGGWMGGPFLVDDLRSRLDRLDRCEECEDAAEALVELDSGELRLCSSCARELLEQQQS